MKTLFSFMTLILLPFVGFSQNNSLIINNNAFVVMDGGVYIVIDQAHQDGITTSGSGGHIVSEDETNKIRWVIKENYGTYTLPYTTTPSVQGGNETKIPYSLEIQTAGVGANSYIDFSTYETSNDMNIPWASMVTQMNDADISNFDNSLNVMDRFWIIDADNYTTKPDPLMTFGYDQSTNEIGGSNTISEVALVAQRFNDNTNTWGGDFNNSVNFWGSSNVVANNVNGVDVGVSDFFSAWVLVNKLSILPVKLGDFKADCDNNKINIKWNSTEESNNDFYTIEKSSDGLFWNILAEINSNSQNKYSFIDENPNLINYYKLYQTDFEGKKRELKTITINACLEDNVIITSSSKGNLLINFDAIHSDNYNVSIYDMRGRQISNTFSMEITEGQNSKTITTNLSFGLYSVVVESENNRFVKKIVLK